MKTKLFGIVVLTLLLQGCSSSRLAIVQNPGYHLEGQNSFFITPTKIKATHALAKSVAFEHANLENKLKEELELRGYDFVSGEHPDFIVSLQLCPVGESIFEIHDPDFMKNTHGSNFPLADPRSRSYNFDALQLEIRSNIIKSPVLTIACILSDESFSMSEISKCLTDIIKRIPRH